MSLEYETLEELRMSIKGDKFEKREDSKNEKIRALKEKLSKANL